MGYIQAGKICWQWVYRRFFPGRNRIWKRSKNISAIKATIGIQEYSWLPLAAFLLNLKNTGAGIYELADTDFNTMTDNFAAIAQYFL